MVQLFISTADSGPPLLLSDIQLDGDVSQLHLGLISKLGPSALDHSRLVYSGSHLSIGRPLESYGLGEGSTLQLLGRLRGGAQLGKVVKGRSQAKKKDGKTREYGDLQAKYAKMQEIDAARVQAENARVELKRRMELEERNSRTNRLKIQNQWRKIMRLAKVESLRRDIEIMSQNHERDVDRKDAIIQMLDRDLEEAEDQYQMALRAHLHNMDRMIDLHDGRLLALEQEFEKELQALEKEFKDEGARVMAQHASETCELQDIMAAVEAQEEERESEARQEHEQLREEIRNKNLEEINVLRITLDTQIEDLEQHFETAHIHYLQNTDQRTSDFKILTGKDHELSEDIEVKIRKIERLQGSLQHWRTKIAQNVKESAERNKLLMGERNAIQAHFHRLRGRMNRFRDAQSRHLNDLVQSATTAKGRLEAQLEQAERIIKLAELARKLETEAEKVVPYYASPHTDEVVLAASAAMEKERAGQGLDTDNLGKSATGKGGDPTSLAMNLDGDEEGEIDAHLQACSVTQDGRPVGRWSHLDNFHKKFNKVLLDKLAIEREQARLEQENAELQSIVKEYLDGISVNDAVLSSANPLVVVNGRVNLTRRLPVERVGHTTTIDAGHMVETGRINTRVSL